MEQEPHGFGQYFEFEQDSHYHENCDQNCPASWLM